MNSGKVEKERKNILIKAEKVSELQLVMNSHKGVVVINNSLEQTEKPINSKTIRIMKNKLLKLKNKVFMAKNSLVERASKENSFVGLNGKLSGQNIFIFTNDVFETASSFTAFKREKKIPTLTVRLVIDEKYLIDPAKIIGLKDKKFLIAKIITILKLPFLRMENIVSSIAKSYNKEEN